MTNYNILRLINDKFPTHLPDFYNTSFFTPPLACDAKSGKYIESNEMELDLWLASSLKKKGAKIIQAPKIIPTLNSEILYPGFARLN